MTFVLALMVVIQLSVDRWCGWWGVWYVLMRLCEALMFSIDTINSTWHISIGQNGLSTRIHQRWIHRIKNADRPRQWWPADVSSGSRAFTHMATTFFHAHCASKQSTMLHHLSPLLPYQFPRFHRIKHLRALYSHQAPSSNASIAPMPSCPGLIFIFRMRPASSVRKTSFATFCETPAIPLYVRK